MPSNIHSNTPVGFYGAIPEFFPETDYQIAGAGMDLPKARRSFSGIEYNQNNVSIVACTLFGPIGTVSDLTGYVFTDADQKEIYKRALNLGFDPAVGWMVSKGVDLVVKYYNEKNPNDPLLYFRVDFNSAEYNNAIAKGYSLVVGYSGNGKYNLDYLDNDVLNNVSFGTPTYGHCVRMAASDAQDYQIIDNYKGSTNETYKIPTANLAKLLVNGVYFGSSYVIVPANDYNNYKTMTNVSAFAQASVQKAIAKGIDVSEPQKIIAGPETELMFNKVGLLTSNSGQGVSVERMCVVLDRAGKL